MLLQSWSSSSIHDLVYMYMYTGVCTCTWVAALIFSKPFLAVFYAVSNPLRLVVCCVCLLIVSMPFASILGMWIYMYAELAITVEHWTFSDPISNTPLCAWDQNSAMSMRPYFLLCSMYIYIVHVFIDWSFQCTCTCTCKSFCLYRM